MLKQIFSGRKHGQKIKMRLMMKFAEIAKNNLTQESLSLKLFFLGILIIN